MTRRLLIIFTLGFLVATLIAEAQPPTPVPRIGVLSGSTREHDRNVKAFLEYPEHTPAIALCTSNPTFDPC